VGLPFLQSRRKPVFRRQRDAVSLLAGWDSSYHGSEGTGFCAHRATCLKADGKDIIDLNLILNGDSNAENETLPLDSPKTYL
jgi:hypothetical protein